MGRRAMADDITEGCVRVEVVCAECGLSLNAWIIPGPETKPTTWMCGSCGGKNQNDFAGDLKLLAYLKIHTLPSRRT